MTIRTRTNLRHSVRLLALAGALAGAGCVQTRMLVLVREDGSGVITLNAEVSKQGLEQLNATLGLLSDLGLIDQTELQQILGPGHNAMRVEDAKALFTPEALQAIAAALGPEVTLLRQQATESAQSVEANALFAFPDIRRVRLGTGTDLPAGFTPWHFTFGLQPGTPNRLSLTPPRIPGTTRKPETAVDMVLEAVEAAPGLDRMIVNAMTGATLQLDLQVDGCLVDGNAEHIRGGNTIALADIRADDIATGADLLRILALKDPRDLIALYRAHLDGVRLQDPSAPLAVSFQPCPPL